MGLFGLVWTLFMTTGKAVNGIKNSIEDSHNKEKSLDGIMYYDYKGRRRLISNNHFCHDLYKDGYRRIVDSTNSKVVWDARDTVIPQNIANYKKEALRRGKTVYRCDSHIDNIPYNRSEGEIIGHQYKDIETGQMYVIREIDSFSFYVDIATNKAVRYTDYTLNSIKESKEMADIKRAEYRNKEKAEILYPYSIDVFKRKYENRNPLEEYNYRTTQKFFKHYYNPKESGGYNYSIESLEERFNCKEGKLDDN